MKIILTPRLEQYIAEKVAAGQYNCASEVVHEALQLLQDRDAAHKARLEQLRREVQKGLDDFERGDYTTYASGEELADEIKRRGRQRLEDERRRRSA